jgi:hypothetical protein
MKKAPRQCQAVTVAGTYSAAHRCLKRGGLRRKGSLQLCAHHFAAAGRARA